MKHEFDKPFNFEGQEYSEIDLDLESLSGEDMRAVKQLWIGEGNFAAIPAADPEFCVYTAARASKKPIEFFRALPAREYMKIAQKVSNFLLG